jgi:hypothetical protein
VIAVLEAFLCSAAAALMSCIHLDGRVMTPVDVLEYAIIITDAAKVLF